MRAARFLWAALFSRWGGEFVAAEGESVTPAFARGGVFYPPRCRASCGGGNTPICAAGKNFRAGAKSCPPREKNAAPSGGVLKCATKLAAPLEGKQCCCCVAKGVLKKLRLKLRR